MKVIRNFSLIFLAFIITFSSSFSLANAKVDLIPFPENLELQPGTFELNQETSLVVQSEGGDTEGDHNLNELSNILRGFIGLPLKVFSKEKGVSLSSQVILKLVNSTDLEKEGHLLNIENNKAIIQGSTRTGLFWGIQTLRQLNSLSKESSSRGIPNLRIVDKPRFSHRGFMLDVVRRFFSIKEIKKIIDVMAFYKLNVLHLHLTDDQGWRLEIKSWPKLTEVGGQHQVGGPCPNCFYTQEQFLDIIEYAKERSIEIIPEIDFPGHTHAALYAYPELACKNPPKEPYTGKKVGHSAICTSKEISKKFAREVLEEVSELIPGQRIHIGGDEAYKTPKKEYRDFMNFLKNTLNNKNKHMIGWQELGNAKLVPPYTGQIWFNEWQYLGFRGFPSKKNPRNNGTIINSSASRIYFDMAYNLNTKGARWAGQNSVKNYYDWDPDKYPRKFRPKILLGVEGALWCERVQSFRDAQYMIFPRLLSVAEIGWTPQKRKKWKGFKNRLAQHGKELQKLGVIHFYRSPQVPWPKELEKQP